MTETLEIDISRLGAYLESNLTGFEDLRQATKFSDGQSNPTFKLTADSGTYVLRRKPPGQLLKSAHAVDREFRVQHALAGSAVPVAQMYHLCDDESIIGSIFYVMEYVDGRIFWDPQLLELDVASRTAIYDDMNRVLVAIHSVDIDKTRLDTFGKPGNYYERQFDRWVAQYQATETGHVKAMQETIQWLQDHMVEDDGKRSLVHGDYRLDNLMIHPDSARISAVMDWELSTLGHPYADLAYQCMLWRMPPNSLLSGLDGVDRGRLGLPSEEEYVDSYCRRAGISSIDNWKFYLVFGFFRLAAIAQGVKKRALSGNASSSRALEVGAMVQPLVEKACEVIYKS